MQLGDVAMVGVGDGGWLWFCQLTGGLLTFWLQTGGYHFYHSISIFNEGEGSAKDKKETESTHVEVENEA